MLRGATLYQKHVLQVECCCFWLPCLFLENGCALTQALLFDVCNAVGPSDCM